MRIIQVKLFNSILVLLCFCQVSMAANDCSVVDVRSAITSSGYIYLKHTDNDENGVSVYSMATPSEYFISLTLDNEGDVYVQYWESITTEMPELFGPKREH